MSTECSYNIEEEGGVGRETRVTISHFVAC